MGLCRPGEDDDAAATATAVEGVEVEAPAFEDADCSEFGNVGPSLDREAAVGIGLSRGTLTCPKRVPSNQRALMSAVSLSIDFYEGLSRCCWLTETS